MSRNSVNETVKQETILLIEDLQRCVEDMEHTPHLQDAYLKQLVKMRTDITKLQEPAVREKTKTLGNKIIQLLQEIHVHNYHDLTIDEISQCYDRMMPLHDMLQVAIKVATHKNFCKS